MRRAEPAAEAEQHETAETATPRGRGRHEESRAGGVGRRSEADGGRRQHEKGRAVSRGPAAIERGYNVEGGIRA